MPVSTLANYLANIERLKDLLNLSADLFRQAQNVAADRLVPTYKVSQWLRAPEQALLLAVVTLLMLTSAGKLILFVAGGAIPIDPQFRQFALSSGGIYVVEAILLILITLYVVRQGSRDETAIPNPTFQRGFRAENRFFAYWPMLWLSWFVLYALLSFHELNNIDSPYLSVVANFLNNLSAMFMIGMFVELTEKTSQRPSAGGQHVWLPMLMVLIVLGLAETLFYARGFYAAGISYVFGLLSGLLVGAVTGLLVARLTSRLFNLPVTALAVLTLFAVIQPVFPVITAQPASESALAPYSRTIGYFVAFAALYAKVVLLITIEWLRDRYGILYYMVNQARIFENERERHMSDSFRQLVERLLSQEEPDPESEPRRQIRAV